MVHGCVGMDRLSSRISRRLDLERVDKPGAPMLEIGMARDQISGHSLHVLAIMHHLYQSHV